MAAVIGIFGYNFTFWVTVGLIRFLAEQLAKILQRHRQRPPLAIAPHPKPQDIAVIMAARNEADALPATLTALKKNLPSQNIYIGSDGSTDNTVSIARAHGCQVVDLQPNRGKAKTLKYLLEHFHLLERYQAVWIMDAEVIVHPHYLEKALPQFADPRVAVFVSRCVSQWQPHWLPRWSMFFTAYRIRLWLTLYFGLRYGQTWKYTNLSPIIPGGASIYRTSALKQIDIDTPGLIIEDFHMTFQVHRKKLGKIVTIPSATIIDQEPYTLPDYFWQVHRWFLGFWQTFFYHGYWTSWFWWSTFLFTLEMFFFSIVILTIPVIVVTLLINPSLTFAVPYISPTALTVQSAPLTISGILISLMVLDYLTTILAAIIERKPILLLYGLGFFFFRYVDTFIFLWTIPEALLARTATGQWTSPTRLATPIDPHPPNAKKPHSKV